MRCSKAGLEGSFGNCVKFRKVDILRVLRDDKFLNMPSGSDVMFTFSSRYRAVRRLKLEILLSNCLLLHLLTDRYLTDERCGNTSLGQFMMVNLERWGNISTLSTFNSCSKFGNRSNESSSRDGKPSLSYPDEVRHHPCTAD
ncbi:hypothetical protein P8452_43658 [Trifolium repens]|nr:hypothetical protein P8452_43658 [Trifolium repens]